MHKLGCARGSASVPGVVHVFLDPDGTIGAGLWVIVASESGVTYATQCVGLSTEARALEGFLVPCPASPGENAIEVETSIKAFFRSSGRSSAERFTAEQHGELAKLVQRIAFWSTSATGEDHPHTLEFDASRADECAEAWVPVITPYGAGVLTFANSD